MKYFTIKHYETVKLFLNRIKHDIGHTDFYAKSISKEYAAGDKVVQLHNLRNAFDIIKLDGPSDKMEEIFKLLKFSDDITKKYPGKKPINNPEMFKKSFNHTKLDDIDGLKDLD